MSCEAWEWARKPSPWFNDEPAIDESDEGDFPPYIIRDCEPLKFCPWCGAKLPDETGEHQ